MVPQKSEVMNTLSSMDSNRYLLSLFVREYGISNAVRVLDNFNIELSSIRDHVDVLYMGLIRLQWWKDEIKKLYQEASSRAPHPLLEEIRNVIKQYPVSYDDFEAMISAREADFEEYEDFNINEYARKIHTPLLSIKAKIIGEQNDIRPLAEAYALIGLLLAIPFYKARSQVFIPAISADKVKEKVDEALKLLEKDITRHRYFVAHRILTKITASHLSKHHYNPEGLPPIPFKELRLWWGTLLTS